MSSNDPPVGPTVFEAPVASWYLTIHAVEQLLGRVALKVDLRAVRQSRLPRQPVRVRRAVEEHAVVVHAPFPEVELVRIDRAPRRDRIEEREVRDDEVGRLDPVVSSSGAARLMMSVMMSEA